MRVPVAKRSSLAVLVALTLLTAGSAGAGGSGSSAGGGTASADGIKVLVPGQSGGATPTVTAPPDAVQFSGGFSYGTGTNGALVSTGSANASVSATAGAAGHATGLARGARPRSFP